MLWPQNPQVSGTWLENTNGGVRQRLVGGTPWIHLISP